MGECVLPMRSRTEAEKGRRAANSHKILATIVSVDPTLTKHGCSVGLRVSCQNAFYLTKIFDENNISHGDIIGRRI